MPDYAKLSKFDVFTYGDCFRIFFYTYIINVKSFLTHFFIFLILVDFYCAIHDVIEIINQVSYKKATKINMKKNN